MASILLWAARLLGVVIVLFFASFAFDAVVRQAPVETAVLVHLLPAIVVALVVAGAWRVPAFGAVAFAALAIGYAVMAADHLDWIAVIAGPLALASLLFGASAALAGRSVAAVDAPGGRGH